VSGSAFAVDATTEVTGTCAVAFSGRKSVEFIRLCRFFGGSARVERIEKVPVLGEVPNIHGCRFLPRTWPSISLDLVTWSMSRLVELACVLGGDMSFKEAHEAGGLG
jgi:hypothetical protein